MLWIMFIGAGLIAGVAAINLLGGQRDRNVGPVAFVATAVMVIAVVLHSIPFQVVQ